MKKILFLVAIFAFIAPNCFAADVASSDTGTMVFTATGLEVHAAATGGTASKDTALIGKCSTGVGVGWKTNVNGYALVTQHKNGTKAYGTSYDSTSIYTTVSDGTPGTVILGVPTTTLSTDFIGTNWKAM